jgi:hypothetical protein
MRRELRDDVILSLLLWANAPILQSILSRAYAAQEREKGRTSAGVASTVPKPAIHGRLNRMVAWLIGNNIYTSDVRKSLG